MKKCGRPFHIVSTGNNADAQIPLAHPCELMAVWATSIREGIAFLKFFDVARIPVPATDSPYFVCGIPGAGPDAFGAGGSIGIPQGLQFDSGLGVAIVVEAEDGGASPVNAGEIVVSFVFNCINP